MEKEKLQKAFVIMVTECLFKEYDLITTPGGETMIIIHKAYTQNESITLLLVHPFKKSKWWIVNLIRRWRLRVLIFFNLI